MLCHQKQEPWQRLFFLGLHVFFVSLSLWGLQHWLGGAKTSQPGFFGMQALDFGFAMEAGFWKRNGLAIVETLAIAILATTLGASVGGLLGMLATRSGVSRARNWSHRALVFFARLSLDVMRAIPDFGWALLLLTLFGAGPVTGALALAISNAGILGRLYSEQWETLSGPARALASTGHESRLLRFFYVHLWAFRSTNRSFTFLRLECTVRNASVIGVVGGGGLGGQIFEAFSLGELEKAIVLFVLLCAIAGWTESGSAKLVQGLKRRSRNLIATVSVLLALLWLTPYFLYTYERIARTDFGWVWSIAVRFLQPDWSRVTLWSLAKECVLPVVLAYLSTIVATLLAFALAFPLAKRTQSRWGWAPLPGAYQGRIRRGAASLGRWGLLIARTLPVEAGVLILAFAWGLGWKAALVALSLHSTALLLRLFYDVIDNHPSHVLEHRGAMRRLDWWMYVVAPQLWPRWRSFVFFLGDANLRSGIVLGMIGVGGIGDRFHSSLSFWQLGTASTCLLCMLVLSLGSDRMARYIARSSQRC